MGIAICHGRKFGRVWGSTAPLPQVVWKLRCRGQMTHYLRLSHGKIGIILRCNLWAVGWSPEGTFRRLYGENRPKSENWPILMPRSSATIRRTTQLTTPWKLHGPWATTWSKQYFSVVYPLTCSLLWVRCLFDPSKFGVLGQMTPEWKVFLNLCPKSAFQQQSVLIFDKCLSLRQTTANNCKTAFSLHVVESDSDEYNFWFLLFWSSSNLNDAHCVTISYVQLGIS